MESTFIDFEVANRIARVTINRPEKMNALNRAMQRDLAAVFAQASQDANVWAILLTATGDRAFCVGADLVEIAEEDRAGRVPWQLGQTVQRTAFELILGSPKPVIAALNGLALGGGCELALCCDIRIAAEQAALGMPEAKVGMGGNIGAHLLSRLIPSGIAFEMLYLGEPMKARDALHWGLVNRVVPAERLAQEADDLMLQLISRAPLTQRRHRAIVNQGRGLPLAAAMQLNPEPNPYTSEDRIEGVAAFAEKRVPRWRAR